MARLTTGEPWPGEQECREPGRVLWLGSEDSVEEMLVPRLMACGAQLANVVEIQGVEQQGQRNTFSMQDDLEAVSQWLAYGEKNQAWSPETLTIKLDDLASKKLNAITRTFDAEMTRLNKAITFLEGELSQPVQSQAVGSLGREIRDHVKALKPDQRQTFIQRAIDSGDHLSATAVLGAPAYLSGFEDQMGQALLRHYHAKLNPDKAKRLRALQGARSLIEANAGKAFTAMEKVVGAPPDKVKKLREANSAAEKHFAMHGS